MANVLSPSDVYSIVNTSAQLMFGKTTMSVVDTSTFVTVGENMLRAGKENTLNALFVPLLKKLIDIRAYKGKFSLISMNRDEFAGIGSSVSYLTRKAVLEESTDWNTDLNSDQLADGSAVDMYTINKVYPYELTFTGIKVMQKHYTTFKKQLKIAFTSEEEFSKFYAGMVTAVNNELEVIKEGAARLTLINYLGALYSADASTMKVNLTAGFNAKFGTAYTSVQLRTTYLKDFLAYFVTEVQRISKAMEEYNELFHEIPDVDADNEEELTLLRHTPKADQKMILFEPLMRDARALVMPAIFNTEYLSIDNYEGVEYWISRKAGEESKVMVKPNTFDVSTGAAVTGQNTTIDYCVGAIFDKRACGVSFELDSVETTPYNAAGEYYNTYYHYARKFRNDLTHKGVIFIMKDN